LFAIRASILVNTTKVKTEAQTERSTVAAAMSALGAMAPPVAKSRYFVGCPKICAILRKGAVSLAGGRLPPFIYKK
jgi:hypothetical protein